MNEEDAASPGVAEAAGGLEPNHLAQSRELNAF